VSNQTGEASRGDVERSHDAAAGSVARRIRRRRGGSGGEQSMVPDVEFTSYYGRRIVKPSPWEADIPAYLFSGGLAAGSSLLAAGADLTGRPALRRVTRFAALASLGFSGLALVHDLGRPMRFLNMLRTMKLTSPMSVGSWILTLYSPWASTAAAAELLRMLPLDGRRMPWRLLSLADRPAGVLAALTAPPLAAYTAALLADTATPSWHEARRELPFVFVSSASAAAAGLGMLAAPVAQAAPARRLALGAALVEVAAERRMEASMGVTAEPMHEGVAGRLMRASKLLTTAGAAGTLLAGRSRAVAVGSGAALLAGSVCTRFGIFEAGQQSANDPKYTVVPQRERLDRGPVG
jgi:formate-dependent nitrite reductase membrane component NrfD